MQQEASSIRCIQCQEWKLLVGTSATKANGTYEVYNSTVNPSLYDWKKYDANIQFNSQNLLEKRFDLSDITLLGTEDSMESMTEVINRFQIRVNRSLI